MHLEMKSKRRVAFQEYIALLIREIESPDRKNISNAATTEEVLRSYVELFKNTDDFHAQEQANFVKDIGRSKIVRVLSSTENNLLDIIHQHPGSFKFQTSKDLWERVLKVRNAIL